MEKAGKRRIKLLFKCFSWSIIISGSVLLLWGAVIEPNLLFVRRCEVILSDLPLEFHNARAVVIADTHFGNSFADRLRRDRIVRYFKREQPELCLLLGDYAAVGALPHYGTLSAEELTEFFSKLKAPWGTYAVLGNHELWYGRSRMTAILERAGVRMLENKLVKVKGVDLAGMPDSTVFPFDSKGFKKLIDGRGTLLLLSHKGGMLRYADTSREVFMLAADTHGGQIRLPGAGSLKEVLYRKQELPPGLSEWWGKKLFITVGAGGHRLKFRLFCPPEIAVVTFKAKGKKAV